MGVIIIREMVGTSPQSWSDAARQAVATASKTVRNIQTVEVVKSSAVVAGRRDRRVPRRAQDRLRIRGLNPLYIGLGQEFDSACPTEAGGGRWRVSRKSTFTLAWPAVRRRRRLTDRLDEPAASPPIPNDRPHSAATLMPRGTTWIRSWPATNGRHSGRCGRRNAQNVCPTSSTCARRTCPRPGPPGALPAAGARAPDLRRADGR